MRRRSLLALTPLLLRGRQAPLRLLVVTGGHDFDRSFFSLFDNDPDWQWEHRAHRPKSTSTVYADPVAGSFDVVVLYDMVQEITPSEQKHFLELFDRGRGVVVLHHALCSYERWAEYAPISGVRLTNRFPGPLRKMTWKHDVAFSLERAAAGTHPVLAGIPQTLPVFDEIYGNLEMVPGNDILLRTSEPESMPAVAWTRRFRQSRIVAIQPGHGPQIFADPPYRRLLKNAIRWVAPQTS